MANPNHNGQAGNGNRPNLPNVLFWDWDLKKTDWRGAYRSVIARVLERRTRQDWQELVHFYGEAQVINALKTDIKYLPDYIIDDVCGYFNLKKEELACYAHKQSRKGHWI